MAAFPISNTTKEDERIARNRGPLGSILFRKNEGSQSLSSGSIVNVDTSKHLPNKRKPKWCLLTSDVFSPGDISMDDYFIEYFNSDLKSVQRLQLKDVAQSTDIYRPTAGLAFIPVRPSKLSTVLSNFNLKSSVFDNRRTFPTEYYYEGEEISSKSRNNKSCFIVGSFECKGSLKVEEFTLITKKDDQGQLQYELKAVDGTIFRTYDDIMTTKSHLCPWGAVILKFKLNGEGPKVTCIGVLNFSHDRLKKISPVFFTTKTLTGKVQLYYPTLNQVSAAAIGCSDGRNQVHASQIDVDLTTLKTESLEVRQKDPGEMGDHEKYLLKNAAALGYQIREVNIPKDGNCLFHAVEDQLTLLRQTDTDHTYESLRKLVVKELEENLIDNHLSIDLAAVLTDKDPSQYIEEMSLDGTWGGHIELEVLSHALRRPIKVVTSLSVSKPEKAIQTIGNSSASPILLGHLHGYHYLSLEAVPSQKYDGKGSVKAAEVSPSKSSHSVVTGRNKHTHPQCLGIVPEHHDGESGNPSQNYDDTKYSNDVSFPQKEEYQQNISFLTTLYREKCDENNGLRRKSELDGQKFNRLHKKFLELRSHSRTIQELDGQQINRLHKEISELRSHSRTIEEENEELRTENEELRAEKEASLIVNKELHTKIKELHNTIKELINQKSRVFEDDSCIGSNKVEAEELPGSSADSGQLGKLKISP